MELVLGIILHIIYILPFFQRNLSNEISLG